MSDLAESERSAGAPLTQSEPAVGPEVRRCMSRGLWVAGWHHVKLPWGNPEKRKEIFRRDYDQTMSSKHSMRVHKFGN